MQLGPRYSGQLQVPLAYARGSVTACCSKRTYRTATVRERYKIDFFLLPRVSGFISAETGRSIAGLVSV